MPPARRPPVNHPGAAAGPQADVPPARTWAFLCHTLRPVGPPVFLLAFLRWLTAETDVAVVVVSLSGGSLRGEFEALGEVRVLDDPPPATNGPPPRPVSASLVYVNTAVSVRGAHAVAGPGPLVAHVHELEVGLRLHLDDDDRARLFRRDTHWVAASRAVEANLVDGHHVDPHRIVVHHEMIAIDDASPRTSASSLRLGLDIPDGAPLVGTAAVVNWRKGPDLFVQLAWLLGQLDPDAHLAWVGLDPEDPAADAFRADVEAAGLASKVHLVAFDDRPLDWMRAFDVFVLTAREDAFPLACLEAASVGVPIVCFASGGMPEFVEDDAGVVVPFPDLDAMADAVSDLLHDPARRRALGRQAAAKVCERHDVSIRARALYDDLCRWETT